MANKTKNAKVKDLKANALLLEEKIFQLERSLKSTEELLKREAKRALDSDQRIVDVELAKNRLTTELEKRTQERDALAWFICEKHLQIRPKA